MLNLIREYQPISRAELARRMQVHRGTMTPLVRELVESGVVWLASDAQTFEAESLDSLTALGIPAERWSKDDLAERVPVEAPPRPSA